MTQARRSSQLSIVLVHPQLGSLRWVGSSWEGTIRLRSWSSKPLRLSLSHPYGDEPVYTPTTAQIAAVEQLLTNEKSTHALIAGKLLLFAKRELRHLPSDVELPRGVSHETLDAKKLSKLISLRTIHVSFELERKRSAIGFQYECAWEPEHGLGVSLDGKRVTLGHADVAFG